MIARLAAFALGGWTIATYDEGTSRNDLLHVLILQQISPSFYDSTRFGEYKLLEDSVG